MRVPRIYLSSPLSAGATVPLDDSAFNHVVRVLRLKPDARLVLFDGRGKAFSAILTECGKRAAWAQIMERLPDEPEPPLRIVLAQGVSRGDRMDFTLQKSAELGASAIQPLLTEYGGVGLDGGRWLKKIEHWRGVLVGACEQCGRNRLPDLREPATLSDWLSRPAESGPRWLFDPLADAGLREMDAPDERVTLLVGPEGGLSAEEIQRARAVGFAGVRLGPRVLRTETAGVAALAAVQALWGDWR